MLKPETFVSNQQFINAWSYIASACLKGEILEANELVITWSGTDSVPFVNLKSRYCRNKFAKTIRAKMVTAHSKK